MDGIGGVAVAVVAAVAVAAVATVVAVAAAAAVDACSCCWVCGTNVERIWKRLCTVEERGEFWILEEKKEGGAGGTGGKRLMR